MSEILEGVKVLDFGRYIAGPFCGALLADYGADVIRIERVNGSEDRFVTPVTEDGQGAMFLQLNRNKLGLTLNPTKEKGKEIIKKLVERSDIVIANLPEQTLKSMSLDYERLKVINPGIILTSNTAFGTSGPYAERVGFDGVAQAMSGAMDMTGDPDQPTKAYAPYVDFCSASLAAFGTVLAYLEKLKTGRGQRVQTSLLQTALTTTNNLLIEQELLDINRIASMNRAQTSGPSDTFQTKDGWILVQTVGQPLFERWVNLMGEEEWLDDERFKDDLSRGENGHLISERMSEWCAERTSKEAIDELEKSRIPVGEVLRAQETLKERHIVEKGSFVKLSYPTLKEEYSVVGPAIELSENPGKIKHRSPELGEHNQQILMELGYTQEEINQLKKDRII
ncbi:CoA transferase [Gammaproteobacteria bacterium]|jgi:crotonobetainyl-CoA:carnitine CoA-transferase CaiB-like acyl-CoA transferase|nr:CoA transferase [Gammaproteobacteria bacterium]MEC8449191.1 CoA transferase [Pseudomonadota bacterium]